MSLEFPILILRPPRRPQILHYQSRGHEYRTRDPRRTSPRCPPYTNPPACSLSISHIHHRVRERESRDGIPRPRLHPPCREHEGGVGFDAPRAARVGDYEHGCVDGVGLGVDEGEGVEGVRGEGGVEGLGGGGGGGPEEGEEGVEVGEGGGEVVGGGEVGV